MDREGEGGLVEEEVDIGEVDVGVFVGTFFAERKVSWKALNEEEDGVVEELALKVGVAVGMKKMEEG